MPKAKKPDELSPASREAYELITKANVLSPDAVLVLVGGLYHYDRFIQARRAVNEHGLLVKDENGVLRKNPALGVEAQSYSLFLAAVRLLGVEALAEEVLPGTQ